MIPSSQAIKILGNPLRDFYISQRFGGMPPLQWMADYYRSLGISGHNGIDIVGPNVPLVYAAHAGTIIEYSPNPSVGIGLRLLSDPLEWLGKRVQFKTTYWHLREGSVIRSSGRVEKGEPIARQNNTGFSTGDHLHFGLDIKVGTSELFYGNGYGGYVDPLPFMVGQQAPEFILGSLDTLAPTPIEVAIRSIQVVFGSSWGPAPIFYRRGLVDKFIVGAVRIRGKHTVYLLGPGGYPILNPIEYFKLFGTLSQRDIVGEIEQWQAPLLGIV